MYSQHGRVKEEENVIRMPRLNMTVEESSVLLMEAVRHRKKQTKSHAEGSEERNRPQEFFNVMEIQHRATVSHQEIRSKPNDPWCLYTQV